MKTFRTIFLLGIFTLLAFADSTEILRPTVDMDTGSSTWATTNCGIASYAANTTSGSLARDAAGQATSVTYTQSGTTAVSKLTSRTFTTWASTSNTYSALTLNVNSSSPGATNDAKVCIAYSLDSGGSWTVIRCDSGSGWPQTTNSVTLSAGQLLSTVKVGVCVRGNFGDGDPSAIGRDSVTVFDIWTSGTLGVAASGNGSGSGTAVQPVQFN